mmetsp:Transcript_17016/g.39826  ORF Transcript_17016/g.39826 Transcript_17016/m.39826 type:complete len:305 (+) Transcript_17016:138-1052(+)
MGFHTHTATHRRSPPRYQWPDSIRQVPTVTQPPYRYELEQREPVEQRHPRLRRRAVRGEGVIVREGLQHEVRRHGPRPQHRNAVNPAAQYHSCEHVDAEADVFISRVGGEVEQRGLLHLEHIQAAADEHDFKDLEAEAAVHDLRQHLGRELSVRTLDVAANDDIRDEGHERQVEVRRVLVLRRRQELLRILRLLPVRAWRAVGLHALPLLARQHSREDDRAQLRHHVPVVHLEVVLQSVPLLREHRNRALHAALEALHPRRRRNVQHVRLGVPQAQVGGEPAHRIRLPHRRRLVLVLRLVRLHV